MDKSAESWLSDIKGLKKWAEKINVEKLLAENDGFVLVENFFPDFVASGALKALKELPEDEWDVSNGSTEEYNDVSHSFFSNDSYGIVPDIIRAFMVLLPNKLPSISAAMYKETGHISSHDDKDVIGVEMANGEALWHSREIAVVYYLTKDWKESYGGLFHDEKTGNYYTPQFNSCLFFRVPRVHEVTPVTTCNIRYSFFGWYMIEGIIYDPQAPNGLTTIPKRRSPRLLKRKASSEA
mmetsp:Transcript_4802/g.5928  ORF Transcript_4802/g.5928 Transcript_4802/m.5928 type:complete len:238 (+) Transcript_4802:2-715(+)